ncbi:phosphoribosyltransferase family protein [Meridianimaribacter flavus]
MHYKTYADLSIDVLQGVTKLPKGLQLVVGVPRSGMVPAYMIAAQLNLPVTSLNAYVNGDYGSVGERHIRDKQTQLQRVLIVDDSVYSGTAITKAKAQLGVLETDVEYCYCAVYSATEVCDFVDVYFKHVPTPRAFQWNYKNHFITTQSCYDIDGVLCVDPTEAENDDGVNYRKFLLEAKPLFIPSYTISCLVTSRLEKYRKETEAWLQAHKVSYTTLIMLDLPDAKTRRSLNIHGKFKAEVYAKRSEAYFVESSWRQAKTIFRLSKKPVFCTENDVCITSEDDILYFDKKAFSMASVLQYQLQHKHFKAILYWLTPPILIVAFKKIKKILK